MKFANLLDPEVCLSRVLTDKRWQVVALPPPPATVIVFRHGRVRSRTGSG